MLRNKSIKNSRDIAENRPSSSEMSHAAAQVRYRGHLIHINLGYEILRRTLSMCVISSTNEGHDQVMIKYPVIEAWLNRRRQRHWRPSCSVERTGWGINFSRRMGSQLELPKVSQPDDWLFGTRIWRAIFFLLIFFVFQPGFVAFVAFVASVAFVGGFCGFTMLYLSS